MLRSIPLAVLVALALSPATADGAGRIFRRAAPTSCPFWRPCGAGDNWTGNRFVPQGGHGVDFRPACQRHDDCYLNPWMPRKECDRQFLNDMRALCEAAGNPRGCHRRTTVYYWSVRLLGGVVRSVDEVLPRRLRR